MDFIKKHYEKVLLGAVLLLATAAVASLPFLIAGEREALGRLRDEITRRAPKPLTNLDLTISEATVKALGAPLGADFGRPHNLFNPVQWQKRPDGTLIKIAQGNEIGPEAAIITKTTPLHLIVSLDSVGPSSSGVPSGYMVGIEKQAALLPRERSKRQVFATLNVKKGDVTLREIKGAPDAPDELIVELADTGDLVSVKKEVPYRRVDGYLADLRYDPEKKTFINRRVNDRLIIAQEEYNIVAITENEVVVSQKLTGKKFTIRKKTEDSQSRPPSP